MKPSKIVLFFFFITSFQSFSQARKANQSNTQYILELMNKNKIEHVYIVGVNKYFQYNKEWLNEIEVDVEYITFKNPKDDQIHSWDLSSTTFIEKYRDVIKVRLSVWVGE